MRRLACWNVLFHSRYMCLPWERKRKRHKDFSNININTMEEYEERQKRISDVLWQRQRWHTSICILFLPIIIFLYMGPIIAFLLFISFYSCFLFCVITLFVLLNCLTGFSMSQDCCQSVSILPSWRWQTNGRVLLLRLIGTGPMQW